MSEVVVSRVESTYEGTIATYTFTVIRDPHFAMKEYPEQQSSADVPADVLRALASFAGGNQNIPPNEVITRVVKSLNQAFEL